MEEVLYEEKEIAAINHLFAIERYDDAEKHITKLLENDPNDERALYFMAVVELSREDYAEARALCEQALKNGYDEETCYHFIATTYQYEKNFGEAEKAYLTALEINPENAESHAGYGYLMLLTGHDQKAIALLEEAKRLDPDNEVVNGYVLRFYFAKSNEQKQLEHIEKAMENGSSEVQKLINLGVFHALKNETKEAREFFRQAFLLDPTNQNILEILEDYDESVHPLFLPHRLMQKVGGPAVVWVSFMVIALLLYFLKLGTPLFIISGVYVSFAIYTWVAPLLHKWFVKGRT